LTSTHPPCPAVGAPAELSMIAAVSGVPDCVAVTQGESARTSIRKSSNSTVAPWGSTHEAPSITRGLLTCRNTPPLSVLYPPPGMSLRFGYGRRGARRPPARLPCYYAALLSIC